MTRYYDACARRFLDALQAAEPRASRRVAAAAYSFALGALIGSVARDGRAARLAGDADASDAGIDAAAAPADARDGTPDDIDATIAGLVAFAAGGLRALIDRPGDTPSSASTPPSRSQGRDA